MWKNHDKLYFKKEDFYKGFIRVYFHFFSPAYTEVIVTRQAGLYGTVTVDYHTGNDSSTTNSANGELGYDVMFGLDSHYNVSSYGGFLGSHYFEMVVNGGDRQGYLLVATGNGSSMLYKWMGTFIFVKVSLLSKLRHAKL